MCQSKKSERPHYLCLRSLRSDFLLFFLLFSCSESPPSKMGLNGHSHMDVSQNRASVERQSQIKGNCSWMHHWKGPKRAELRWGEAMLMNQKITSSRIRDYTRSKVINLCFQLAYPTAFKHAGIQTIFWSMVGFWNASQKMENSYWDFCSKRYANPSWQQLGRCNLTVANWTKQQLKTLSLFRKTETFCVQYLLD